MICLAIPKNIAEYESKSLYTSLLSEPYTYPRDLSLHHPKPETLNPKP